MYDQVVLRVNTNKLIVHSFILVNWCIIVLDFRYVQHSNGTRDSRSKTVKTKSVKTVQTKQVKSTI